MENINCMKDYLVCDYDEGDVEIVDGFDVEEKVEEIRRCGNMAVVTEIIYGEVVIDDARAYFKKLNANKKRAATIARKKAEAEAS